jgi:hypothetical protein
MQFFGLTTVLVTFAATVTAMPSAAGGSVTDLDSCLAYASNIPHSVASTGFANGCQVQFNGADAQNLTRRADDGVEKRCKSEHDSCCCMSLCLTEVTCPACATGCTNSCVDQYGGDCAGGSSDCGKCT